MLVGPFANMIYATRGRVDISSLKSWCSIQDLQAVLRICTKMVNKTLNAGGERIQTREDLGLSLQN